MSLTIIIPSLRRSALKTATDSVLHQTVPTDMLIQYDTYEEGAGPTRNRAMQLVKTDWVGFCDDDDELDPHYHEWLQAYQDECGVLIFRMKNQPNGGIPYNTNVDKLKYNEVGISFAMKTEIAKAYPFKNMLGEDYELLNRLRDAGVKIKISKHIAYYVHGLNGTN